LFGQSPGSGHSRQIWFVGVMLLILIALIAGVALGLAPTPTKRAAHPATATVLPSSTNFTAETKSPTVKPSTTASPTALCRVPAALVTPTQTAKPSLKPSSTTTPTTTPTPTLTPTPTKRHALLSLCLSRRWVLPHPSRPRFRQPYGHAHFSGSTWHHHHRMRRLDRGLWRANQLLRYADNPRDR